jgi:transketolase
LLEKRDDLLDELRQKAREIRCDLIRMLAEAGSGHSGGSLSAVEIVTALYWHVLRVRPEEPAWPERDRFVLSKGHAAPVLYAALAERGFFPAAELQTLRKLGSRLQGHPDLRKVPGVEASTGSLGQGLSVGLGMALAGRLDRRSYRVYVLLGDGECEEGQVWEAAMAAAHYHPGNLTAIIDNNGLQIDGPVAEVLSPLPLPEKWRAFGWEVTEVDGHDLAALLQAFDWAADANDGRPKLIVAHTVKGQGVSFMENQVDWHGKAPSSEQAACALKELGSNRQELDQAAVGRDGQEHRPPVYGQTGELSPGPAQLQAITIQGGLEPIATRDAYGRALVELGGRLPDLVVLDADLSKSTKTGEFAKVYPDRFFDMGIAEQNLMGTAAGLALAGKIPCASTFAIFATGRAYDQIRNTIAYAGLNVKIVATHAGITVGEDGGSHQALEDIGLMRALPGMTVIVPADATETRKAVEAAVAMKGPCYIRLGRTAVPVLFGDEYRFQIGKAVVLKQGTEAVVFACGIMVSEALKAAEQLAAKGVSVAVVDVHTIKPLDLDLVVDLARRTGAVVTAEEHSINGGLGSAVAEALGEHCPVPLLRLGVRDRFGESGKPAELMEAFGLTAPHIVQAVEQVRLRSGR